MLRSAIVLVAAILASPATTDERLRNAVMEILADAGAHAAACEQPRLTVDKSVGVDLFLEANLVPVEVEKVKQRMEEIFDHLRTEDPQIICRDALERYGPSGTRVVDLLIIED